MRKFTLIDGDMDWRLYERKIEGRLTPKRFKILHRFVRNHSYREHCGCEHDCCGCKFAQGMDINFDKGTIVIQLTESFNY